MLLKTRRWDVGMKMMFGSSMPGKCGPAPSCASWRASGASVKYNVFVYAWARFADAAQTTVNEAEANEEVDPRSWGQPELDVDGELLPQPPSSAFADQLAERLLPAAFKYRLWRWLPGSDGVLLFLSNRVGHLRQQWTGAESVASSASRSLRLEAQE